MRDGRQEWGPTAVHDLHSEAVGDDFRLFVTECGANPQATLLVVDGNGLFGLAVDTVRMMQIPALIPPLLVVGIGYPDASTLLDTIQIRARDLTPTRAHGIDHSGGGDEFRAFINGELHQWLSARFPAAAQHLTFFGHSLGGLFGTHVMLSEPSTFSRYILSSPSLWWDKRLLFDQEQTRARTDDDLNATVFFGIGGLETDEGRRREGSNLPDDHWAKPPAAQLDMVDDMAKFVDQLRGRGYSGLDLRSVVFPDEFHATVPGLVLSRALRHFEPVAD